MGLMLVPPICIYLLPGHNASIDSNAERNELAKLFCSPSQGSLASCPLHKKTWRLGDKRRQHQSKQTLRGREKKYEDLKLLAGYVLMEAPGFTGEQPSESISITVKGGNRFQSAGRIRKAKINVNEGILRCYVLVEAPAFGCENSRESIAKLRFEDYRN